MEFSLNVLRAADIVGTPVKLKYKGSSNIKTPWGGFLTLILSSMFGLLIFSMGKELFDRESPVVWESSAANEDPQTKLADLPLVFYFVDNFGRDLTEDLNFTSNVVFGARIFKIVPDQQTNVIVKSYDISMERCSAEKIGPAVDLVRESVSNLENLWCLDLENVVDSYTGEKIEEVLWIKDEVGLMDSAYFSFYLKSCKEQTNLNCVEKLKKFPFIYMGMSFVESYLDVADFNQPIKQRLNINMHLASTDLFFRRIISLRLNEFLDDTDFIFKASTSNQLTVKGDDKLSISTYSPENRFLYTMIIEISKIKTKTFRKYQKIQEVVANIGGLSKAALFVAQLFAYNFSEYTLFEAMALNLKQTRVNSQSDSRVEFSSQIHSNTVVPKKKINVKFTFWKYLLSFMPLKKAKMLSKERKTIKEFTEILFISKEIAKISGLT